MTARRNMLDRVIAAVAPVHATRRERARRVLAGYEAARPSRFRRIHRDAASGDVHVSRDAATLRAMARYLERNDDIARGALSVLVRNVIGAHGIGIEPMPRLVDGTVDDRMADRLHDLWQDWSRRPEVTWSHPWTSVQRLMCRSWLRDGEAFSQELVGNVRFLDHGTRVPLSLELLEADLVPLTMDNLQRGIRQGLERNAWGRIRGYYVYRANPGDLWSYAGAGLATKRVDAERMLHLRVADRISQARGISQFASVITRLQDVKDYEESERVAAKVAASMAAYIKKGTPDLYEGDNPPDERELTFKPGMVFDDLVTGEDIGTIDTQRPSSRVTEFRDAQLRAVASGSDAGYSAMSRNYNGTYSAQRQELVEIHSAYALLADEFVQHYVAPVYERFVFAAAAAGLVRFTKRHDLAHVAGADYRQSPMPWIDPVKEAEANKRLVSAGFKSATQVIRERGDDWKTVFRQIARERAFADALGIEIDSDPTPITPDEAQQ